MSLIKVIKVTTYKTDTLSSTISSTSFQDSGFSWSITTTQASSTILISLVTNIAQNDTWNSGSVKWLKSVSSGSYVDLSGTSNTYTGTNFMTYRSGGSSIGSSLCIVDFDSPGASAGATIVYKLQLKQWTSSNPVRLGTSTKDGDNAYGTSQAGTTTAVFYEIAP
jgi:hypothetical protein